jgi:hypothetical protein
VWIWNIYHRRGYEHFLYFLVSGLNTIPSGPGGRSIRRYEYRESHLDKLFVLVDRFQGASHIATDLGRTALLYPKCQFHDGCLKGELVFVDLEQQGREQV